MSAGSTPASCVSRGAGRLCSSNTTALRGGLKQTRLPMIAIKGHQRSQRSSWQKGFAELLPQIEPLTEQVFRHLDPDRRDEAKQSATVFCLLSYMRLHRRGRAHVATASTLVFYAALQVKRRRPAGGHMNAKDLMSEYAQSRHGFKVAPLHTFDSSTGNWIDSLVEDKRAPIPDVVAVRLDSRAWLASLDRRTQRIAADLAQGCSTSEVARKHQLSAGRISQMRRELENSWTAFQHEDAPTLAS